MHTLIREQQPRPIETPVTPEAQPTKRYELRFDVITISGTPGTGKTAIGQKLSEMYGIPYIKIGDLFRGIVQDQVIGFQKRPKELDRMLDQKQVDLIRQAARDGKPIILEARLASVIATQEIARALLSNILYNTEPLSIVRFNLTAEGRKRYPRILRREKKRDPGLTLSTVKRETQDRHRRDLQRFQEMHPQIKGINPYSPGARDKNEYKLNDYDVSTTGIDVDQGTERLHGIMVKDGFVLERLEPNGNHRLPQSGQIFPAA